MAGHEHEIKVENYTRDQNNGLLQGFDINLGPNEKPLHVNLKNYSPHNQSFEATKQLREDFSHAYQDAIDTYPDDAGRYFKKITKDFPHGIAWEAPGQDAGVNVGADSLIMRGAPNMQVPDSGREFIRLHGDAALRYLQRGNAVEDVHNTVEGTLQGAAREINNGDYFTPEQKDLLNARMAENASKHGLSVTETFVHEQSLHQAEERTLG